MKTEIGVSEAALGEIAAQGKNFDRATLNAMLKKLADSPAPKVTRGPMAMCYCMSMPVSVEVHYVCPKCGMVTRYMSAHMEDDLALLRDGAATLKGMGLDIVLDESPLCHVCSPEPKRVCAGRIAKATGSFAVGDEVVIQRMFGPYAYVSPYKQDLWVSARHVDRATACITADSVRVQMEPGENGRVVAQLNRGHKVEFLPMKEEAPEGWIRIKYVAGVDCQGAFVSRDDLTDLSYGDGDFALEERFDKVSWIINGKRTLAQKADVELLETFLSGSFVLTESWDEKIPLKWRIGRLRELLGEPKK